MVAISIQLAGHRGLTWPCLKRIVVEAEDLGFAGIFCTDHFTASSSSDTDSLEMVISLAYIAQHTKRIHFGPLVAPLSFRHPALLARQAIGLDNLSGGRMILGVGSGWQEREHLLFGYELGDTSTRIARLEEGLEIITRLIRNNQPSTYRGRFFQLHEAILLPHSQNLLGTRILNRRE